jgi:hypothetical protein
MANANNAKLMRRTTRAVGGKVPNELPLTAGKGNQFSVVVEGTAGRVLGASSQPYMLEIVALDITASANPHSEANHFTHRRLERFDAAHGWSDKVVSSLSPSTSSPPWRGHLLRYYATLISANQIISFVESQLFLLYKGDLGVGAPTVLWRDTYERQ